MKRISYVLMVASLALAPLAFTTGCAVTQGRETAGAYAQDKEIATKIKAKLYKDPIVKGTQVEVNVLNGEVQLSGFVDNADARARAEQIAAATEHVRVVHNNLLLPTGR